MFDNLFPTRTPKPDTNPRDNATPTQQSGTPQQPGTMTDPTNPQTGPLASDNKPKEQPKDTPQDPLDEFQRLMDTKPSEQETSALATSLDLPPEELAKLAGNLNFTSGIDEETIAAIENGDTKAVLAAINRSNQETYQKTMSHMAQLINANMEARFKGLPDVVTDSVQASLTSSALQNSDAPVHPLVQQELNRVANEIRKRNPQASPEQVAAGARNYLEALTSNMSAATKTSTQPAEPTTEIDYGEWMGITPPTN